MWEKTTSRQVAKSPGPRKYVTQLSSKCLHTSWERQFCDLIMAIARNLFIPGDQLTWFSDFTSSFCLLFLAFCLLGVSSTLLSLLGKEEQPPNEIPRKDWIHLNEVINYQDCFHICTQSILTLTLDGQGSKGHKLFYSWGNWGRERLSHLSM